MTKHLIIAAKLYCVSFIVVYISCIPQKVYMRHWLQVVFPLIKHNSFNFGLKTATVLHLRASLALLLTDWNTAGGIEGLSWYLIDHAYPLQLRILYRPAILDSGCSTAAAWAALRRQCCSRIHAGLDYSYNGFKTRILMHWMPESKW